MNQTKQRKYEQVNVRHSCEISALHQHANVSLKELKKIFPQYSQASLYRHAKRKIGAELTVPPLKTKKGRPKKLCAEEHQKIITSLHVLRETDGSFTSPRVAVKAGVATKVSTRTVRRVLNKSGYGYYNTRRKGVMMKKDFESRTDFCNKILERNLGSELWTQHVSFYLDATGFEYKTNPYDQARAPKSREWRRRDEGLIITAKGKKEGVVSTNFMVGISYNCGVVLCERYEGAINGDKMVNIILNSFPQAFKKSVAPRAKRLLMDGCPRQNCKKAQRAYNTVGAKIIKIPARSPDLNPIENFFHLAKKELKRQARANKITHETMEEYNARVENTLHNFPTSTINNLIASMEKRIDLVLKAEGRRIKY